MANHVLEIPTLSHHPISRNQKFITVCPVGLLGKRKLRRTVTSECQKTYCRNMWHFPIACHKMPTLQRAQHVPRWFLAWPFEEWMWMLYIWMVAWLPCVGSWAMTTTLGHGHRAKLLQEHVFVQQHFCGQLDHVANHDILHKRAQVFLPSDPFVHYALVVSRLGMGLY